MKTTGLNGYVCDFSVDYRAIAAIRHSQIFNGK